MSVSKSIIEKYVIPLVADRVLPKVEELIDNGILKAEKFHHDLYKNRFEEYLSRRYESFSTIDTLVLQNQQVPFHSLYYPLTLQGREKKEYLDFKIESYDEEFIPKFFRVLVVDSAGMGKSTVLKKLFLSAVEENTSIPVFIELRKLNENNGVLDEIHKQLNPIHKELSKDFIISLIRRGDFVFLFDGFDEIPFDDKDTVIKNLHEFIEKANGNYFVISSRPEDSLASFSDFKKFNIKPLNKDEAFDLIRLYAQNDYKSNSEDLINILQEKRNLPVHEFLSNPLLVSLLYAAFDYGKEIPLEKAQFYSLVYDALYYRHDLTKEGYFKRQKYSGLHRDNFEKILRGLGYITFKEGKIEFRKGEILRFIQRAKSFYKIEFAESDYFEDLIRTVPLFKKDGNFYKWSHKSLQDYFATRFMMLDTGDKKESTLLDLYDSSDSSKYLNIFELAYYLDFKAFRNSIVYAFLKEFIDSATKYLDSRKSNLGMHKKIYEKTYFESYNNTDYFTIMLAYNSDRYPKVLKDDFNGHMHGIHYMDTINWGQIEKEINGVTFEMLYDDKQQYYSKNPFSLYHLIGLKSDKLLWDSQKKEKEKFKDISKEFCDFLLKRIETEQFEYVVLPNGGMPSWIPDEFAKDYHIVVQKYLNYWLSFDYCSKLKKEIETEREEEKDKKDFL